MSITKNLTKEELDKFDRQLAQVEKYSDRYYLIIDYWTQVSESRNK